MHREWIKVEHDRIHVMELWPDGPMKTAGLASVRSALESLARTLPEGFAIESPTCAARRRTVTVIPGPPRVHNVRGSLAA